MQIQKTQNNNPNFQGLLIMQNLRKGGRMMKRETSKKFDKASFDLALRTVCNGRYRYDEWVSVTGKALKEYGDFLKRTKGINLPKTDYWTEKAKLYYDDGFFSIDIPGKYRIYHSL